MILQARFRAVSLCSLVFLFALSCFAQAVESASGANESPAAYNISAITMEQTADDFLLRVRGESPPTYTMYELFEPLRVILDIADAKLVDAIELPQDLPLGPVAQVMTHVLDDQKPFIARIEIILAEDRGYTVERQGNDIVIMFSKDVAVASTGSSDTPPVLQSTGTDDAPSPQAQASTLFDIDIDSSAQETRVLIKTDGPVADYKKAQLPKASGRPDRMYIDIPNLKLTRPISRTKTDSALARVRAARRGGGVRIVFDSGLDDLFSYNIVKKPDGMEVVIAEPSSAATLIAEIMEQQSEESPPTAEAVVNEILVDQELIQPIFPKPKPAEPKQSAPEKPVAAEPPEEAAPPAGDTFAFAGYEKQKISVDFYKIDLHNVFRLFGEISDLNIVVDEAVSGSLTLALSDVPWDFALDIILNLKDLQKEERFNTLVISPKSKEFVWPQSMTENIAFKADGSVEKVEALAVTQRLKTPKEIVEAKKLLRQANMKDRQGDFAVALPLYEAAFEKWPDNSQLANRIATICLVHLGMNAKAVHYAKAALQADPSNLNAALQAAIGLANMQKVSEAKEYFDLAISDLKPASEALISYAAFCEQYESYNAAILLLKKHQALYSDTLDTMIAKARIYDKKGESDKAVEEYRAILLSGYDLPKDLKQYIQGRVAMVGSN